MHGQCARDMSHGIIQVRFNFWLDVKMAVVKKKKKMLHEFFACQHTTFPVIQKTNDHRRRVVLGRHNISHN